MHGKRPNDHSTRLTRAISAVTAALGSFPAIVVAVVVIVVWLIGGIFVRGHFANNTYQLLINTGTTIVTFAMVFIIQNTQNRDGRAVQTKLDAQGEVLRRVADSLGIDGDGQLRNLAGLEDAPEKTIKQDQQRVRRSAG